MTKSDTQFLSNKIIEYKKLPLFIKTLKNKKKILVGGCFELLHYGHLFFLRKAKELGNYLIVALESDEFILKQKKKIPIHNQNQRAEILASLRLVDLVIKLPYLYSADDYSYLVKLIKPNYVAVTSGDPQLKNKTKQVEVIGGKVKVVSSLIKNFGTRKIINFFNSNFTCAFF